jgi:hypothetical protein
MNMHDELLFKYGLLDNKFKKQVDGPIISLLISGNTSKQFNLKNYKKKILKVSTWSREDIQVFCENMEYS